MKNLKKFLAIFLSIAMVMCSTLPSFASETETTVGASEEIVESSEETLVDETSRGEACEPEEDVESSEETLVDETSRGERLSETAEEETEESSESGYAEEPEEDETTAAVEESEEDETTAAVEESEEDETTAAEEETTAPEETSEDNSVGASDHNDNVGASSTSPEESAETAESSETAELASPSELVKIVEDVNEKLLGATPTPWMYWWTTTTTTGTTIHFSSSDSGGANPIDCEDNEAISYGSLDKSSITKAVFEDNITAVTCESFFQGFTNLTIIDGLEKLTTNNVKSMKNMFSNCEKLKYLDLGSFNTSNVEFMAEMFSICISLKTIIVSNEFSITKVGDNGEFMFVGCDNLYGCNGTKYTHGSNNKEYARIDGGSSAPGYFSSAPWMYWYLSDSDETIHYTNTKPTSGDYEIVTRLDRVIYNGLEDTKRENITKAKFDDNITAMTCGYFFSFFKGLASIENLEKLDTTNVTNMQSMFAGCEKIESLELSNWTTGSLTDMGLMFKDCSSLTLLNVSNFDTSKVQVMVAMFENCSSLKELDLTSFNTSSVLDMQLMFYNCSSLKTIYASNSFVTTLVVGSNDQEMFTGCTSLEGSRGTRYDASHVGKEYAHIDGGSASPGYFHTNDWMWWKYDDVSKVLYLYGGDETGYDGVVSGLGPIEYSGLPRDSVEKVEFETDISVRTCEGMFDSFTELKEIVDIEHYLNTSSVMSMERMFYGCEKLTDLDVTKFDTSNVTNMSYMFSGCKGLTNLDVTKFDTSSVINMTGMFNNCENLKSIHLEKLEVSKVKFMTEMFNNCKKLESLNLFRWNAKNLEKIYRMFAGCSSLTLLDISNFDTSRVTDMREMFRDCSELTKLDLTKFDTKKVTDFDQFLYCCSKLTSIDLHSFDTSNVKNMRSMFSGCENLVTIFVSSKFVTTSLVFVVGRDVFTGCNALIGGAGTTYDDSHTDIEYARIDGGPASAAPGYFTLYVPPTPPAPYYPGGSSGSSGSSGGGGGGGPVTEDAPAVTYLPYVKSIIAFASNLTSKWSQDAMSSKWKLSVTAENGSETNLKNGFILYTHISTQIVGNTLVQTAANNTYVFDENGNMITGWVHTVDGKTYFFENKKTSDEGKMIIGWKQIQGSWYCFGPDGAMYKDTITPDGHPVGPDGKWRG